MDKKQNIYEVESQFIREKENEILNKAKNVHQELNSLRNQKIDLLCQVFKEQLDKDMESDLNEYNNKLAVEYNRQAREVQDAKNQKMNEFDRMISHIEEQIKTFQMIIEDLRDKKEEVDSAEQTAQEYIKKERQRNLEEYRQKCERVVAIKVKEFRSQLNQGKHF